MRSRMIAGILIIASALSLPILSNSQSKGSAKPFILGEIQTLQSRILHEKRILNIYLPEGYNTGSTARYPVIYLLDGSADEDFIHIAGLVQFCSFPWVGRLSPSIVVGIANIDRKRDFTYPSAVPKDKALLPTSGGSAAFIDFIEKELQPFIEARYRTTSLKTIIGESLGGLLATEILMKKPQLFNQYIIVSPSLWWNDGSLLHKDMILMQSGFRQPTYIYIGVGKEGLGPSESPHVMEVDANILAAQLRKAKDKNIHVFFDYLPGEDHGTIMHQAVSNAFRMLCKGEGQNR